MPQKPSNKLITIELAHALDLPVLNKISWSAKAYWGYPEEWMNLWKDDLTITKDHLNKHKVVKIKVNQQIAGFCMIILEREFANIEHLWIHPDYIGQKLGGQLLKYCLNTFVSKGKEVRVISDPNAEGFYKKIGFQTYDQWQSKASGRFLPMMKMINL